jgi:hypothetical protein
LPLGNHADSLKIIDRIRKKDGNRELDLPLRRSLEYIPIHPILSIGKRREVHQSILMKKDIRVCSVAGLCCGQLARVGSQSGIEDEFEVIVIQRLVVQGGFRY